MLKRLTTVSVVLAMTLAMSGIALADDGETATEGNTVFSWAYDVVWRVLVWNLVPTDFELECGFDGDVEVTYSPGDDGLGIAYTGDCDLDGGSVAGPNGQVNHGMFMKLFNSLWDGEGGRGCVVRHLAQSDLGKGDQQVRVPEVDADAPELGEGDTGEVEFDSVLTECRRGNEDKVTGQEKAAEKRAEAAEKRAEAAEKRAEKAAAQADKPRGKSDQAPGRNR